MAVPSDAGDESSASTGAGGARGWLAPGIDGPQDLPASPRAALEHVFALAPSEWLRRIPGRETFAWPGRPRWIVKRTVGGEPRDYWYDRLRASARSPARREAENLAALAADGFPVPRVVAWFEEAGAARHPRLSGRNARSALIMERVEHEETLRQRLGRSGAEGARALVARLAQLVGRLHASGWYHRDLYLQHFVVTEGSPPGLVLLDVGRARREAAPRRRWFVKDLAALWLSTPEGVSTAARRRFLGTWLTVVGKDPGDARAWASDVLDKARRLAAHAPRKVDPRTSRRAYAPPVTPS